VVVSRQPDWQAPGALGAGSVAQAVQLCATHASAPAHAWVIGGAQIYAQALPLASTAVVTEIDAVFEGDAFAPSFGPDWVETSREAHVAANGLAFSFVTYTRT
jgi:dihydrofolate reductase